MLDINFIRDNLELVKTTSKNKRSNIDLDQLLAIDTKRREFISQVEQIRQQRNELTKDIKGAPSAEIIEKGKELKTQLDVLEPELEKITKEFNDLIILVPNIHSEDTPIGKDEDENVVIRSWGEKPTFDFPVRDHVELGEMLDVIDIETASKVAGTRFNYLKGKLVSLQLALVNYTLSILQNETVLKEIAEKIDPNLSAKAFVPVLPPLMIKPEVYVRMARLDSTNAEEKYFIEKDDLYLIGSAEHTLGPLHIDQTIEESQFPLRYVGYSSSFRREAGSYGKDTRGIIRVHQFDKLEMMSFTLPEHGQKEQDFIVGIQEHLLQSLKLPYQVVSICTGDMGTPDFRQIDMETWVPSQEKYRETHTSDYNTDYQSRRLNTKVKRSEGKNELVHTNDATAFAIGRILVAIMENYQQKDGSIKVPEALVPFTRFDVITTKN
jgi:seryl-tRNA synthetase